MTIQVIVCIVLFATYANHDHGGDFIVLPVTYAGYVVGILKRKLGGVVATIPFKFGGADLRGALSLM